MSEAGKISKGLHISRKAGRAKKKFIDRTVKETHKNLRDIGAKIKFETPKKGGRRRYVDSHLR